MVTNAWYFLLLQFCDVYLELIKPIVGFNANSEA